MDLLRIIHKNMGIADFLQTFVTNCPNCPSTHTLTDIDIFKINFCRYTKRAMYYAENFVSNLIKVERDLRSRYDFERSDFATIIPDDIFFDFDAFVFSCKSIMEGKIMERSKGFHPSVKDTFCKYARLTFDRFVTSYLTPLRDEVVHLNRFGSAAASMAWIRNSKLHIRAFDYSDNFELQRVFEKILVEMSSIINRVTVFIIRHECCLWGFPQQDAVLSTKYGDFKVSDFIELPSFKHDK